jgi:type II secretory pathway component HofQ
MKTLPARLLIAWLGGFFLLSEAVLAETGSVQIYTLHHQIAESLLPAIQDTLLAGESVNAYNNELVVNASPASQQKVENLLQALDKPLRNILIAVRNNSTGSSTSNNTNVSGGIRTGEVYLGAGGPVYRERPHSGGGVTVQSNGVRIQSNREMKQTSAQQEQSLRAIEGNPAWISTGQTIPYRGVDQWGNAVTEYRNADRGFYVTARIIGDRVQLDISTSNDSLSEDPRKQRRGVINTQRLQTTASGNVGDWINLGGISLQDNTDASSYTGRNNNDSSSIGDISVRIIPVD